MKAKSLTDVFQQPIQHHMILEFNSLVVLSDRKYKFR